MTNTLLQDYAELLSELQKPRWDKIGESRYMTHANGYVMVRRPGRYPYIIAQKEWLALPLAAQGKADADAYKVAGEKP